MFYYYIELSSGTFFFILYLANKSGRIFSYEYGSLDKKFNELFGSGGSKQKIRAKLPKYILDAIEHVTDKFPDDLDSEDTATLVPNNEPADD